MLPHLPLVNKVSKCIFFTLIAFSCSGFIAATAQTNKIEILKTVFRKATAPAQKTDAALAICDQSHSLSTDTLYYYAQVAKKNAMAISDRQKEILSNTFIEDYLARKNLFDSAIRLCDADLKNISYANDRLAYTKTMMQKCHCLERANRNRAALDLAYQFLGEAEKFNDTIPQLFLKTLIGVVYRNMQQTELAMRWFLKADSVTEGQKHEEIKNQFGIFFLIGMMYNWIFDGETNANKRLSDSLLSISYLDRAIADSRRFGNLQILAKALNVKAAAIGNKEHAKIEGEYILEAQHIYNILQDTISMLNTISPMCFYYIDEGHPEKGVKACLDGIAIASRTNSYPILDLYSALGQCYYAANDYKSYSQVLDRIIKMKDSIYKVNTEKDLAEFDARYKDKEKENIIIQQKLDIASKKYSVQMVSTLTAMLLAGILLLARYYKQKQKKMEQQEIAAVAAAEEAERKRISADLHDNIGAYAAAAASTISSIHAGDEKSNQRLSSLKHNVQDMISQLNDSIWALNKKEVRLTGVSDRFKIFVQKLEPAYPDVRISINEEIEEQCALSPFQALHLFRIMQEALNNALRHSRCATVNIFVRSKKNIIQVDIEDDGTGIASLSQPGNGINNLKMRAKELGWKADWQNKTTGGTIVTISSRS